MAGSIGSHSKEQYQEAIENHESTEMMQRLRDGARARFVQIPAMEAEREMAGARSEGVAKVLAGLRHSDAATLAPKQW